MSRVASPANETTLIDLAGHATAAQTERIVRNYRQALTLEGPAPGRPDRGLICQWDGSGSLLIRGRLAPEQGAVFLKALEQALEEVPKPIGNAIWDQLQDYHVDTRRADALVVLSERSLNAGRADTTPAERFQVVVSVSAETLAGDAMTIEPGADLPQIDDGPAISAERARRLCCDGSVVPVLESASGEILNVGRKTRTIPPALRRALKRRDGHCQYPGCVHTRNLHSHHLKHWAHGGETSLLNTLLLCSRHHRMVHEGGYRIRRVTSDSGTTFEFLDPQGRVVPRADDLRGGDWQQLVDDVSAETPGLHAGILIPELDWRPPDYDHIAWWMVNFMGR